MVFSIEIVRIKVKNSYVKVTLDINFCQKYKMFQIYKFIVKCKWFLKLSLHRFPENNTTSAHFYTHGSEFSIGFTGLLQQPERRFWIVLIDGLLHRGAGERHDSRRRESPSRLSGRERELQRISSMDQGRFRSGYERTDGGLAEHADHRFQSWK